MNVLLFEPVDTQVRLALSSGQSSIVACKDELLSKVDALLHARGKRPPHLEAIVVRVGVGTFSTLRICQSVANALAFAWDLPVYALLPKATLRGITQQSSTRFISVRYSGKPRIGNVGKMNT